MRVRRMWRRPRCGGRGGQSLRGGLGRALGGVWGYDDDEHWHECVFGVKTAGMLCRALRVALYDQEWNYDHDIKWEHWAAYAVRYETYGMIE
jgi:hypothetical protein